MREAYDQWHSGQHQGVTCHSCHESNLVGSLKQVWTYVTRRPDEVETHAQVAPETCLSCHGLDNGATESSQADVRHSIGQQIGCLVCHGQELHNMQPVWGDICTSCHE